MNEKFILKKEHVIYTVLCLLGLFLAVYIIQTSTVNKAILMEEYIYNSKIDITLAEERQRELIPQLIEIVVSATDYEGSTLVDLAKFQGTQGYNTEDALSIISGALKLYPELKAIESFNNLFIELVFISNQKMELREWYNKQVTEYNIYIRKQPSSTILKLSGYDPVIFEKIEFDSVDIILDIPELR